MIIDLETLNLSDDELRRIFKWVYARGVQPKFLQSFAAAFLLAEDPQDFILLRKSAVMLVAKYNLGCFLCESSDLGRIA
jgi:hypothetical protein